MEQVAQLFRDLLRGIAREGDRDQSFRLPKLATLSGQRRCTPMQDRARGFGQQIRRDTLRRLSLIEERLVKVSLGLFPIPATAGFERDVRDFHGTLVKIVRALHALSTRVSGLLNSTIATYAGR